MSHSKILITGGKIVNAKKSMIGDILIENGIIQEVSPQIEANAELKIIDAKDHIIIPGGIDPHTHMDLPVMGTLSADDFESGSRAALHGGTTTIIDFANQRKSHNLKDAFDIWIDKAKNALCDYSFHISITDLKSTDLEEILKMVNDHGITSFKTFMAYKGMRLNEKEFNFLMKFFSEHNLLITCHCEIGEEIEHAAQDFLDQEKIEPKYHPLSRPAENEAKATQIFLELAHQNHCPAYVVHMSNQYSVNHLREYKKKNKHSYGETCIQYLLLDDSHYEKDFKEASKYILSPPLRNKNNHPPLWEALADGTLDVVATDHCPFTTTQRQAGKENFTKIPNGIGAVEERMILLYGEGVAKNRLSLERLVEVSSTNAAKIFGLYPKKGVIQEGSDADLVIIDPKGKTRLNQKSLHSKSDYSCYENWETQGKIVSVFAKGTLVTPHFHEQGSFLKRDK